MIAENIAPYARIRYANNVHDDARGGGMPRNYGSQLH